MEDAHIEDTYTDDTFTVWPHILRTDERVAVADVDGVGALIVPVSEEGARCFIGAAGLEGVQITPATIEEIEEACACYRLAAVGLYGLDGDMSMDVLSVETLALVFEERDQ
jgi:hypothetical protein